MAAATAPAIVRAGSIMRINPRIIVPAVGPVLTCDVIAREALKVLQQQLVFMRNVNNVWDSTGWAKGTTIRIARPPRYMKVSGG